MLRYTTLSRWQADPKCVAAAFGDSTRVSPLPERPLVVRAGQIKLWPPCKEPSDSHMCFQNPARILLKPRPGRGGRSLRCTSDCQSDCQSGFDFMGSLSTIVQCRLLLWAGRFWLMRALVMKDHVPGPTAEVAPLSESAYLTLG